MQPRCTCQVSRTHSGQCCCEGHQIPAIHSSQIGVHSNWAYSHLRRQRFSDQDCQSQPTHWSLSSCGNQVFCTSALATHEGHHSDSPSWSRESRGHAYKSARLGAPPWSCPLPHGALWQSLPVNCLGSASSFYFHQDNENEYYWFLSLTIYIGLTSNFFGWPFLSSCDARCFASGEGVSGPVVRPADETHTRCITNGYLRMKHDRERCNGIGMISRDSLNKSSLFQYFTLCAVWLD